MKTFLCASALSLAAVTMLTGPALADYRDDSVTVNDGFGDQTRRSGWTDPWATTAVRNSSDLDSATFTHRGDRVSVTWRIKDVLPYNQRSYSTASAHGYMDGKFIHFDTGDAGRYPQFWINDGNPRCQSRVTVAWNPAENFASMSVPVSCLPTGSMIAGLYGGAYTGLKKQDGEFPITAVAQDQTAVRRLIVR